MLRNYECDRPVRKKKKFLSTTYGSNLKKLNFDVESYTFADLDLQNFACSLSRQDHDYLVLYLMGHPQSAIGEFFAVSRSKVSKRLGIVTRELENKLR